MDFFEDAAQTGLADRVDVGLGQADVGFAIALKEIHLLEHQTDAFELDAGIEADAYLGHYDRAIGAKDGFGVWDDGDFRKASFHHAIDVGPPNEEQIAFHLRGEEAFLHRGEDFFVGGALACA